MSEIGKQTEMPSLFPELLSLEELHSILQKKWPKLINLDRLSHNETVSLYRSSLLPLPQRKYSSTYRGRLLHKRRLRCGLEQLNSNLSASSTDPEAKKMKLEGGTTRLSSANMSSPINENTKAMHSLVINKRSSSISQCSTSSNKIDMSTKIKDDETPPKPKRAKITWP